MLDRGISAGLVLAGVMLAGTAHAEGRVTATLETPLASPIRIQTAAAVWDCAGTRCISGTSTNQIMDWDQCQEVVKKVGRILTYKSDNYQTIRPKTLARCNSIVPAAEASTAKPAAGQTASTTP